MLRKFYLKMFPLFQLCATRSGLRKFSRWHVGGCQDIFAPSQSVWCPRYSPEGIAQQSMFRRALCKRHRCSCDWLHWVQVLREYCNDLAALQSSRPSVKQCATKNKYARLPFFFFSRHTPGKYCSVALLPTCLKVLFTPNAALIGPPVKIALPAVKCLLVCPKMHFRCVFSR